MFIDQCIEVRLREFRVIPLIMSVTTITYHIDEYIRVELLAVFGCNLCAFYNSLGIVAIHMKNRSLDRGGEGSTIVGTARIVEISSEANLIIDHKMYSSTCVIPFEIRHLQYFIYDPLPRY